MASITKIGFWGYPHPDIIKKTKEDYPNAEWIDLDIDFYYPKTNILPESYCKIIRNIIDNAMFLKPDLILAPIGKDKCDSGWFASKILADMGFNVIQTIFEDLEPKRELKICTSNLPLYDKITRITGNIIDAVDQNLPQIPAEFAQAFCAKSQLAKYLADKYNGLYVDIDDYASNSISAKIEAFLRLS